VRAAHSSLLKLHRGLPADGAVSITALRRCRCLVEGLIY
jgi:hypothetical protein